MATLIGGIQMAGKADFMKREAELEDKIVERNTPVQYNKVEKIAERILAGIEYKYDAVSNAKN